MIELLDSLSTIFTSKALRRLKGEAEERRGNLSIAAAGHLCCGILRALNAPIQAWKQDAQAAPRALISWSCPTRRSSDLDSDREEMPAPHDRSLADALKHTHVRTHLHTPAHSPTTHPTSYSLSHPPIHTDTRIHAYGQSSSTHKHTHTINEKI